MKTYRKNHTQEISFPLGGIGTGSISLGGNGVLQDFEIGNRPAKGKMNRHTFFAVRAKGQGTPCQARILCGDADKEFIGHIRPGMHVGYGYGVEEERMAGFPHFRDWKFHSRFPFADISFSEPDFPAYVTLSAFNPFIPLDEDNSSIPAAFFEVTVKNTADVPMDFSVAFSVSRLFRGYNEARDVAGHPAIFMKGDEETDSPDYRDMTMTCLEEHVTVQPFWYRGTWRDGITTFFREFSSGAPLTERFYAEHADADTATLCTDFSLAAGESKSVRFLLSWNTPNCYNYWLPIRDRDGKDLSWRNYYAVLWENSLASAAHATQNWDTLAKKSRTFSDAVLSSSLPSVFKEAAICNLATLKSSSCFRLEDGSFWAFEGTQQTEGSCFGTCSHVFNYAYALPFLFPRLERSIRENEYRYNMMEDGAMAFRLDLPAGTKAPDRFPCVDGQMGSIIKTYREWKLSGDTDWLASLWDKIKAALSFAWKQEKKPEWSWDADCDGVLEGRCHHTLDMELFAPSSWLQGFYLAALRAAAEMADSMNDTTFAEKCRSLYQNGSQYTEKELFNGEYYIQKIDLHDRTLAERFGKTDPYWSEEHGELKYQIGDGCEIDQIVAQWHANLCGLGDIFDKEHRRSALSAIYRNNYKKSLRNFANPWRVFALQDEGGTVMCDYPAGTQKPAIPLSYCEECMTGFEYAFAGLLMAEGMQERAQEITKSVRDRYDGKKRNPFSEIECGSNYARAMSSFAFLPIFSGFSFDMTKGMVGWSPLTDKRPFRSFFSLWCAWGSVHFTNKRFTLRVEEGALPLKQLKLEMADRASSVSVDGKEVPFRVENSCVMLDCTVKRSLVIRSE